MKLSIIDIGTQSLKHYIFEVDAGEKKLLHHKRYSESNIGENNVISEETLARSIALLSKCLEENEQAGVASLKILGTDIFRKAENAEQFLKAVYDVSGHAMEIITHEKEAEYLYEGFVDVVPTGFRFTAANIGGGSLEVVVGDKENLEASHKFPFGVKYLRNTFPADDENKLDWRAVEEYLSKEIKITEKTPNFFTTGVILNSIAGVGKHFGHDFKESKLLGRYFELPIHEYLPFVREFQSISISLLKEKYYAIDPSYADNAALAHTVYAAVAVAVGAEKVFLTHNDLTDGVISELLHMRN